MTLYYRVEGRVQGVAFRYYTSIEAKRLGITGSVRNLTDGSVEIYASSNRETLSKFENFLKEGPGHSIVEKIEKSDVNMDKIFKDFLILS
ncbi:MAG: acylphosphatase [Candidatus Aminicenantes bacterium]|nr:acylphosphatase [Candidatus Aminicenantes bacterium]